jgi:hemolysin activation/secretion protein
VSVGRVSQVRTVAVGDRVRSDWKVDNEIHARIRRDSPIQASGVADDDQTDLIDRKRLEDYLYRLNRHPGRRVEAALAPGTEPGDVVLDYRVVESKPWYVYGQVANTGTQRSSPWQTRFGVTHRQLTNHDDILSIEYLNAGGDDVNGLLARYQAPFFGPRRPDWMNRRKGDPAWLDWIPRDDIPWWGVDRLRWEVDFGWGRADANRSSTLQGIANDPVTSRQFNYGGRFIYETLQIDNFFVDLWGGLRLRDVNVRNKVGTGSSSGDALFVVPTGGVHAERINQISTFGLDVGVQGSVSDVSEQDLDGLGRDSTDDRYAIIDFNLGYSTFLEPLLRPAAWRDPTSAGSSTLAHEIALGVRGQYAFDYRLVPQASQTLGGLFSVRGYDQSVAVGDTIVVGSFEYRFHLPRSLPAVRQPLRIPYLGDFRVAPQQPYGRPDWDLVFRAFVDAGRAIRNDRSASNAGVNEYNQTLVGAGVGAELLFRSNFRARIDWATALKDTNGRIANPADVGDSEIYVLFSILY